MFVLILILILVLPIALAPLFIEKLKSQGKLAEMGIHLENQPVL